MGADSMRVFQKSNQLVAPVKHSFGFIGL